MFWVLGREACGILGPPSEIEPTLPELEGRVLTTGPPGKSHRAFFEEAAPGAPSKKRGIAPFIMGVTVLLTYQAWVSFLPVLLSSSPPSWLSLPTFLPQGLRQLTFRPALPHLPPGWGSRTPGLPSRARKIIFS